MATGVGGLQSSRILLFLRLVPLLGVAGLGVLAFVIDLFGLLEHSDWLARKLPSLIFAAIGVIALYLAIERFSGPGEIAELKQLIGTGEGFRRIPAAEVSRIAARMMPDVETLRTLGTARQDFLDVDESARLYLTETERRVHRKSPFRYYRITSERLRDAFIRHLVCLLGAADSRHDIQVQLIPNIETTVTYQIFDNAHVLVILDTPYVPDGRRNYAIALMSSDAEIVKAFIAHFDNAWSRRTAITDPQDLGRKVTRIV